MLAKELTVLKIKVRGISKDINFFMIVNTSLFFIYIIHKIQVSHATIQTWKQKKMGKNTHSFYLNWPTPRIWNKPLQWWLRDSFRLYLKIFSKRVARSFIEDFGSCQNRITTLADGKEELEKFKHISLIAWTHVNFHGYYNFNTNFSEKALHEMIESVLDDENIEL